MPQLTEQEIKLQQKFAELRKKKELKRKEAEDAAAAAKAQTAVPSGGSALDKAKAILAKKAVAEKKPAAAESNAPKARDPLLAAKRALEVKRNGPSAAKRPALKRPSVQRTAPKPSPKQDAGDASNSPHSSQTVLQIPSSHRSATKRPLDEDSSRPSSSRPEPDHQYAKRARIENPSSGPVALDGDATLFVGDLPPYYKREDLFNVFAQYGEIEDVRVMGTQCYAFVKFQQSEVVQSLVEKFSRRPLVASGHELRINQAHGQLPDWKRAAGYDGRSAARAARGAQHPRVVEAQKHGDALAQQLLAAGSHGLDFSARPCQREMVTYDDL